VTPTEYLTARLDEEEAVARAAETKAWASTVAEQIHILRWDPARVLADVAAKRAIVEEHKGELDSPMYPSLGSYCVVCREPDTWDYDLKGPEYQPWPCRTIRALLQPYAARADFDERWRS